MSIMENLSVHKRASLHSRQSEQLKFGIRDVMTLFDGSGQNGDQKEMSVKEVWRICTVRTLKSKMLVHSA